LIKSEIDCLQAIIKTINIANGGIIKVDLNERVQKGLSNLPSSIRNLKQVMLKEIRK
jgi:hypothetical protein